MVDAADTSKLESAKQELHALLDKPQLNGIPCLVLGNKNDLPNALGVEQLIEALCVPQIGALLWQSCCHACRHHGWRVRGCKLSPPAHPHSPPPPLQGAQVHRRPAGSVLLLDILQKPNQYW